MTSVAALPRTPGPAARRLSPLHVSVALTIALIGALWLATWQRSRFETEQAVSAAIQANSGLAIAYEENAANAIREVDQVLRLVEVEYREEGPAARGPIDDWQLDHDLIHGLAVVDAGGNTAIGTGDLSMVGHGLRGAYEFHRDHPGPQLRIGHPEEVPSNWELELRVAISRRMEKPDGTFAGIVLALVDPAFFTQFYRRARVGANGLVSLVLPDGIVLARQTGSSSTYGDDLRASTLFTQLAANPTGAFTSHGKRDGTVRFVSYRTMGRYPLIVEVGSSAEEMLAPVRARTRLYFLLAAAVTGVIVLVAFGVMRSLDRQRRDFEALSSVQARLRDSAARHKAITENMAGAVVTTAANGVITGVNSAACLMFGYESGEMVGGHFAVLLDESLRADALAMLEERGALSGDFKDDERDILCERKDGTVFEAELLLSGVIVDGQRIYTGIVHDISGRKALERALRRSEALFRATFDQALVGIVHASLDGSFIRVNRTACEMLGYSEHEMLALGFRDVTHPEDLAVSEKRLGELLADPALPFHVTKRYLRKDGSAMWSLTSVSVIRRDGGLPDFFLAMIQDITELKHLEQMKNEFISTVSHELRTPLTSVHGSLGLLAGGVAGALPPPARELVLIAERSSQRLILLVNDILDTERLESGKMRFELKVTELRPLVERAVESMEGFAREHRVLLRVAAPEEPIRASVDADRLIQVMTNLISNAVKFSPPEATVEVELARTTDGGAKIEVRDRGPGVPREFQPRIFQRFSQADSSSSRQKRGTGLGLSIAKAIVEHLGGTIGYRTSLGKGSTFFVRLPAAAQAASAPATALAKEA